MDKIVRLLTIIIQTIKIKINVQSSLGYVVEIAILVVKPHQK